MVIRSMLLLSAAVISFACTNTGSVPNTTRENSAAPAVSATPVPASPERTEPKISESVPADLEITLSRNACYGRCPVYSMSVRADGSVEFDGKQFTEAVGKTSGTITTGDVLRIFNKFEKIGFFEFDDEYTEANCPMSATDLSTYIVSVTANGKTKKISHYTGCVENNEQHTPYPPGLLDLENKIQDIAESKGWIK